MWKLVSFSLLVLTSALFAAQDVAQPTAEESRILTLENAWNQAIQQKDGAALLMLLGPELVYIEYDGRLMNKAEYLADAQQPSLHPARVVGESLSVHVYARLRWRSEFAAKAASRTASRTRFACASSILGYARTNVGCALPASPLCWPSNDLAVVICQTIQ